MSRNLSLSNNLLSVYLPITNYNTVWNSKNPGLDVGQNKFKLFTKKVYLGRWVVWCQRHWRTCFKSLFLMSTDINNIQTWWTSFKYERNTFSLIPKLRNSYITFWFDKKNSEKIRFALGFAKSTITKKLKNSKKLKDTVYLIDLNN